MSRWKKMLLLVLVLFVPLLSVTAQSPAREKEKTLTLVGYLIDKKSAREFFRSSDPVEKARAYTRRQAVTKTAQKAGYGVLADGAFYPFDETGNRLVLNVLRMGEQVAGITVKVTGTRARRMETYSQERTTPGPKSSPMNRPPVETQTPNEAETGVRFVFREKNELHVITIEETAPPPPRP